MHSLLERQLRRHIGEESMSDPKLASFVEAIDAAYRAADTDRALLERSIELASAELIEQNRKLELDLESIKRLELELRQADKLRAVGQLAAGIAHEINTPIQFVGDTLRFLEDSFRELLELGIGSNTEALVAELPLAFSQAHDGVKRVAQIVAAMRQFGRPDQRNKSITDLNGCLADTLTVAANELRLVADVLTEFGEIPLIPCYPSELNQVFLNLVVNAAHAISERYGDNARGSIVIRTKCEEGVVTIAISDDGCGIPPERVHRIFEPFFTTKPVGKGTGQGLAIARSIVSDKHGGTLTFESAPGAGTTFFVRLPAESEPENMSDGYTERPEHGSEESWPSP